MTEDIREELAQLLYKNDYRTDPAFTNRYAGHQLTADAILEKFNVEAK